MVAFIIILFYILPFIVCALLGRYYNNVEFLDRTDNSQVVEYVGFSMIPIFNIIIIFVGIFYITKDFVENIGTK
jgi:hypothetical protein|nr:MAG TPA: hypothetical protein [Bacteriophage sp.]